MEVIIKTQLAPFKCAVNVQKNKNKTASGFKQVTGAKVQIQGQLRGTTKLSIAMAQGTVCITRQTQSYQREWMVLVFDGRIIESTQERTRSAFHNGMLKTTKNTKPELKAARDDERAVFKEAKGKPKFVCRTCAAAGGDAMRCGRAAGVSIEKATKVAAVRGDTRLLLITDLKTIPS